MKAVWIVAWVVSIAAAFALGRYADLDRPAALDVDGLGAALQERDAVSRLHALSGYLQQLGPENLDAAREVLVANQVGLSREEIRLFMLAWSRFDPSGAYGWAAAYPTRWRTQLMGEALYAWGFRDGPAALRAVEAIEDEDLVLRLRPLVMEGWLGSGEREAASAYVASVSDPKRRRRLTFALAGETLRDGPAAVRAWAESIQDDAPNGFKQGAFYHAASALARDDPRGAGAWFVAHRDAWYSQGSLDVIARKWAAHHDPVAAFAWLEGLPAAEGERASELSTAMEGAFRTWLHADAKSAEAWLTSALPDPRLDGAIAELVRTTAQKAPAHAADWAARIEDPNQRRRSFQIVGRNWLSSDPAAARSWLEADVPEDLRQGILQAPRAAAKRRPPAKAAAGAP